MKYNKLILILIFAFSAAFTQAQSNVFDKLSERKDIQAVHVNKALLEMLPKVETGGVNIAGLVNKLDQLDIYTSEANEAIKYMNSLFDFFDKDKAYENFMSLKEKDQKVVFYGKQDNGTFKDLVMIVSELNKCTIIRMRGSFTAKDIQNIMKK